MWGILQISFKENIHINKRCNIKSVNYKLYNVIRSNGGWSNWKMEIFNCFNCKDLYEPIQLPIVDNFSNEIKILTNLVFDMMKNNNEMQKQMMIMNTHN